MMSTTRLRNIHQQEQRQRKFMCVMNDVAKTKQDRYDHFIDTEKAEATQRSKKAIECTRRNIVRQRVLKKCMQNKREEVEKKQASTIYGKYHGVSIDNIADEIDTYLLNNHPRNRKSQKIKDLFDEGYDKGAILDKDTVKHKVTKFFDRPLVELHKIQEVDETSSKDSPCLPPVGQNFYTGDYGGVTKSTENILTLTAGENLNVQNASPENDEDKLFVKRKVSKFLTENVPDDFSGLDSDENVHTRTRKDNTRPVTLPPMKIGTDNADHSKPAKGSIAELAAKFAKSREKTQRRLLQGHSSRKQEQEKTIHQTGGKQPSSRRPKSDRTGIKDVKSEMFKLRVRKSNKKADDNNAVEKHDENDDPLAFSLPPIKFKSSAKRVS